MLQIVTTTATVVGVVVAVVAAYWGFRATRPPKRALHVSLDLPRRGDLRACSLTIHNRGVFDIGPDSFVGGSPVAVSFDVKAKKLLTLTCVPDRGVNPQITINSDGQVVLEPCLLQAGESIIVGLEMESNPPTRQMRIANALRDTRIELKPAGLTAKRYVWVVSGVAFGLILAAIALAWSLGLLGEHYWIAPDPARPNSPVQVCGSGVESFSAVRVYWDEDRTVSDGEFATGQADRNGWFCANGVVPELATPGNHTIEIRVYRTVYSSAIRYLPFAVVR